MSGRERLRGTSVIRWEWLIAVAVAVFFATEYFLDQKPVRASYAVDVEDQARLDTWAVVKRSKEVAPGKTVTWIAIPSTEMPGDTYFDTHCLLFETPTGATVACPGADQTNFSEL